MFGQCDEKWYYDCVIGRVQSRIAFLATGLGEAESDLFAC